MEDKEIKLYLKYNFYNWFFVYIYNVIIAYYVYFPFASVFWLVMLSSQGFFLRLSLYSRLLLTGSPNVVPTWVSVDILFYENM